MILKFLFILAKFVIVFAKFIFRDIQFRRDKSNIINQSHNLVNYVQVTDYLIKGGFPLGIYLLLLAAIFCMYITLRLL